MQNSKAKSKLTSRVWRLAGCPLQGALWENKKIAKKEYRTSLKLHKWGCKFQRITSLKNAMKNSNTKDFWSKWNKNNCKSRCTNTIITAQNFADQFCNNFSKRNVNKDITNDESDVSLDGINVDSIGKFDVENVEKAVCNLKLSKSLDYEKLSIAHILYAHPAIYMCLTLLYNAMFLNGYVPNRMGISIVLPTVKSMSKSTDDITNYRPISIMPIIGKIFEKCIGRVIDPYFKSHDNQFGFVENTGCNKALFTFRNIVNYFNERGSKVYCCSLDIAKAFDQVDHTVLLRVMLQKGMPYCVVRIFLNWWNKLYDKVSWKGNLSNSFAVLSGVLQGSILGGKFFNLIMDCVLDKLQCSYSGCNVDKIFAGAIAYADDLILLSPSLIGMQDMLDICIRELNELGLKLNIDKCVATIIGKCMGKVQNLLLNNNVFEWNTEFKYLGIIFRSGDKLKVDVSERSKKFIGSVASVLRDRVIGGEDVYVHVIKTKCMPLLFYGIDCLRLDSISLQKLTVIWNTAFRWALGIYNRQPMRNFLRKCGTMSFQFIVDLRFLIFIHRLSSNCTKLMDKLLIWYNGTFEMKEILQRYKLWKGCDLHDINNAVSDMFNNHCNIML
jgi:hypothetical protein